MMGGGNMGMIHTDPRLFARSDANSKASLPLAADHFDKVRLSRETAHEYELVALSLLHDALERSRKERIYGGADESWRDIGAMHGFKRFAKVEGETQHYRIQGVVRAPMTNVMSLLYAERSASMVARRNVFYGNALDAQSLRTIRERTHADRHQHMALRWESFNISTATENFKFDASLLEYTGITHDHDRQPIGFKIAHSMDLPQVKPLFKSHGLRRIETTEIMLLRPSGNSGYTEISLEGSFEVDQRLPSTAIGTYLTLIAQHLGRVPMEIQAHRLATMKLLDKSQWVPTSERKNCSVCLSRFGMMGKKHHCRACGEVVCKSCIVTRPTKSDDKFCKKCVVVACAEDELVIPERFNPLHTPSSHSSSSSTRQRDTVRDSYVMSMHRLSEAEQFSTSLFNPQTYQPPVKSSAQQQPQYLHDMKVAPEELKHYRDDNHSMTASETSYGSTFSSSGCFTESMTPVYDSSESYLRPRPEDSMIYLDTKMMRFNISSTPVGNADGQYGSGRGYGRASPPTMLDVESSLAHQRHLLKEMMSQASQHSNRSYRAYPPVSHNF